MTSGIAVASACGACAHEIPGADQYAPDRYMGIIGADHVAELQAIGWVHTVIPHGEPDDIACPHYHAAWIQDPGPSRSATTRRSKRAGHRAARPRRHPPHR